MINDKLKGKYGLVLNGGGGKASYQTGVFTAIRKFMADTNGGFDIAGVAGSSAGALNTCLWLFDEETYKAAWDNIRPEQLIDIDEALIDGYEGLVNRDGLLEIMNNYVDMNVVSSSPIPLYATIAEYDESGMGKPVARYISLNGKSPQEIKTVLLASTCLPVIYEPVVINGKVYRDGGLADNMPVKPLYDMGLRKIIIVCCSTEMPDVSAYPDVEFIIIRPSKSIGEFIDGTLDFRGRNAQARRELGYMDGMRTLTYYGNPYVDIEEIKAVELRQFENKIHSMAVTDNAFSHVDRLKQLYDKY